jgi:hypothetical protein
MAPVASAQVEAPTTEAKRKAGSKPKARRVNAAPAKPKETKIFAGRKLLESDQVMP